MRMWVWALLVYGVVGIATRSHAQVPPNLIVNGDAEGGVGSSDGYMPVAIPSWTVTGGPNVVQWAVGNGFPTVATPGPTNRGLNYFTGGTGDPIGSLSQTIDVSTSATEIDAGTAPYTLCGFLGGYLSQSDQVTVLAEFLDGTSSEVGSASIGPVLAAERSSMTALCLESTSGTVPSGTRTVSITMTFTRINGTYGDGYADNLNFLLAASCPETGGCGVSTTSSTSIPTATSTTAVPATSTSAAPGTSTSTTAAPATSSTSTTEVTTSSSVSTTVTTSSTSVPVTTLTTTSIAPSTTATTSSTTTTTVTTSSSTTALPSTTTTTTSSTAVPTTVTTTTAAPTTVTTSTTAAPTTVTTSSTTGAPSTATTSTAVPPTVTTTTVPPQGCTVAATFASVLCRLDALGDDVASATDLGTRQAKLAALVAAARANAAQAETAPSARKRKALLAGAAKKLAAFVHRLASRGAQKTIPEATRTRLASAQATPIRADVLTLRRNAP